MLLKVTSLVEVWIIVGKAKASARPVHSVGGGANAKADYALRKRWNFCIVVHEESYILGKRRTVLNTGMFYNKNMVFQPYLTCFTQTWRLQASDLPHPWFHANGSIWPQQQDESTSKPNADDDGDGGILPHCIAPSQSHSVSPLLLNPLCICPVGRSLCIWAFIRRSLFGIGCRLNPRWARLHSSWSNTWSHVVHLVMVVTQRPQALVLRPCWSSNLFRR